MIIQTLNENAENSESFIKEASLEYYKGIDFSNDTTHKILDTSIITHQDRWDKKTEIIFADLFGEDKPYNVCTRQTLKRVMQKAQDAG